MKGVTGMRMVSRAHKVTIVLLSVAIVAWCIHVKLTRLKPNSPGRTLSVAKFIRDEQALKVTRIVSPKDLNILPKTPAILAFVELTGFERPVFSTTAIQHFSLTDPVRVRYPLARFCRPPPSVS